MRGAFLASALVISFRGLCLVVDGQHSVQICVVSGCSPFLLVRFRFPSHHLLDGSLLGTGLWNRRLCNVSPWIANYLIRDRLTRMLATHVIVPRPFEFAQGVSSMTCQCSCKAGYVILISGMKCHCACIAFTEIQHEVWLCATCVGTVSCFMSAR